MVSYTSSEAQKQQPQQERSRSEYHLHSVQRPSPEKTNKKPALNTLAQPASGTAQPRVYNVKPIHFRELVQRLTGASPAAAHHRQQTQPRAQPQHPPLSVSPYLLRAQNQSQMSSSPQEQQVPYKVEEAFAGVPEEQQLFLDKKEGGEGLTTELMLSPNFQAWFSLALLSPGSVL